MFRVYSLFNTNRPTSSHSSPRRSSTAQGHSRSSTSSHSTETEWKAQNVIAGSWVNEEELRRVCDKRFRGRYKLKVGFTCLNFGSMHFRHRG